MKVAERDPSIHPPAHSTNHFPPNQSLTRFQPAPAMATSGMSALLMPFFIFLLAGSSAAAMDRLRWQVDSVNRRGLVMSYVDEASALQASGYFSPCPLIPFLDLYGKSPPTAHGLSIRLHVILGRRFHIGNIRGVSVIYALTGQRRVLKHACIHFLLDFICVITAFSFSSSTQLSLYRLSSMSSLCLELFTTALQAVLMTPCHSATLVSQSWLLTQGLGDGRYVPP